MSEEQLHVFMNGEYINKAEVIVPSLPEGYHLFSWNGDILDADTTCHAPFCDTNNDVSSSECLEETSHDNTDM
jgi:hypothetical protein